MYIYAAFNFHRLPGYSNWRENFSLSQDSVWLFNVSRLTFKALDAIFEKNKMMKIKKYLYYEVTWSERRLHIEALTLLWIYSEAN